jgi:gas vesicle protein
MNSPIPLYRKAFVMTEGFRSSPPPTPEFPTGTPDSSRYRQEVTDTVQRIMGEDIAPPQVPPTVASHRAPAALDDESSTTEVAKDQAGQVADTAKQAGTQVAGTVKEQAGQVTAEAGQQAKQLLSQAQSEVTEQAAATQQRVAEGLHALADELTGMAKNSEQDGPATDLARQAADKAHQAAGWLADRDPGALLDEVRSFARRKPGAYLAIALGAGVLAGRLTRGLTAPASDTSTGDTPSSTTGSVTAPADTSAGLLGRGPAPFDGTGPVGSGFGSIPPAVGAALPQTPAPMGGFGDTEAGGYPGGVVAP